MHLLKNNFQAPLVTRRDAEKEKRDRARKAIDSLWWVKDLTVPFMTLCLWLTLGPVYKSLPWASDPFPKPHTAHQNHPLDWLQRVCFGCMFSGVLTNNLLRVAVGGMEGVRGRVWGKEGFSEPHTHSHFPAWVIVFYYFLKPPVHSLLHPLPWASTHLKWHLNWQH